MNLMRFARSLLTCWLLAGAGVTAAAQAPRPEPAAVVSVHYADVAHFTETRRLRSVGLLDHDDYLGVLKRYLIQRARRVLAPGERLNVTITDIARAGNFEPWHGPDLSRVRIVKPIYPPRIDLTFKLYAADGRIVRQGKRKLTNLAFMNTVRALDQDPLRYEKNLIDRWLSRGPTNL